MRATARSCVLHGIEIEVAAGEVVALLGPNGAGKTTLLRAISGLLPWQLGWRAFRGRDMTRRRRRARRRAPVWCMSSRAIASSRSISVTDNLLLAGYDLPRGERAARIEEALSFFPEIAAKRHERGGALSGGQQQMLAVAQGLVRRPRLLMLDEPSAGLSPVLVDRVLTWSRSCAKQGTAVLLVEQLIEKALAAADRVYALVQGNIVLEAPTSENRSAAPARTRLFRAREPCVGDRLRTSTKDVDPVIPGWSEGLDLSCAIAHRGVSRFRVRCRASPRNDEIS